MKWLADLFSMRTVIRLLPLAAVVYGGGISGAWLGRQFVQPLPEWVWGWFGAGLTVFSVLVGIELMVRKDWTGWGIMLLSGAATCVMDYQYFKGSHDFGTSVALGILPTGIAILGGIAASRFAIRQETAETARETDRERWERERQEKDDEHRRRMDELKLKAELKAVQPHSAVQNAHSPERPVNAKKDYAPIYQIIKTDPFISIKKLSEETGLSVGGIHGELKANGYHKNGNGWEVMS